MTMRGGQNSCFERLTYAPHNPNSPAALARSEGLSHLRAAFLALERNQFDKAIEEAEVARQTAGTEREVLATSYIIDGWVNAGQGTLDGARNALEKAMHWAKGLESPCLDAYCQCLLGLLNQWQLGGVESERSDPWHSVIDLASQADDTDLVLWGYFGRGLYLCADNQFELAIRELAAGRDLAVEAQAHRKRGEIENTLAWVYFEIGDLRTAIDINNGCVERANISHDIEFYAHAVINLAECYMEDGELLRACQELDQLERHFSVSSMALLRTLRCRAT